MVAKIVKGKSFKGVVNYVLDKAKQTQLLVAEGARLKSCESIIRSFIAQAGLNPKVSKTVGHISLDFSAQDKDKLTNVKMVQIAKEYMVKMGITNTQYIIGRHFDREHPHCHIVFNRVDNDGKTISDRNDRYRNEKVCKQLKDKYNLTYGKGKENVNVQKLKGAEKTKYEIYHAVKGILPKIKDWQLFEESLKRQGISIEYKLKSQTNEVQGISFRKGDHSFKGSDVDRRFSYSKPDKVLNDNSLIRAQQQESVPKETGNFISENIASGVTDIVSGLGGLFDIQPSGGNPDEAEHLRQPKKKKKKRRGFGFGNR